MFNSVFQENMGNQATKDCYKNAKPNTVSKIFTDMKCNDINEMQYS